MKTEIFISIFVLNFLGACRLPDLPTPEPVYKNNTFRIQGTITDSTDNSPVVGATVNLLIGAIYASSISMAKTDNGGHYAIEIDYRWEPKYGAQFWLMITATGYKTKHTTDVFLRITEEWQTVNVQLEREIGELGALLPCPKRIRSIAALSRRMAFAPAPAVP